MSTPVRNPITEEDLKAWTNQMLLVWIHAQERLRLNESKAEASATLDASWPEGYALVVAEAQRRKLCL